MQIIAGTARGVPLKTVPDLETRPILDRVKKSLFSILDAAGLLHDSKVLDLYAGTGTLGLEALSRGAASCVFVERRDEAVKLLYENLAKTRLADRGEARVADVNRFLEGRSCTGPFDLIFFDPPFAFSAEAAARPALESELALAGRMLSPTGRLILRTEKKTVPPEVSGLALLRHWTDGPHALCFYVIPDA